MTTISTFSQVQKAVDFIEEFQGNRQILTFNGFSEAGYECEQLVGWAVKEILSQYDPEEIIVNAGATKAGIGLVYEIARQHRFTTLGIVSTQAIVYDAELSSFLDQCIYVEDKSWGGYLEEFKKLSPTSEVMVEISNVVYALGGGYISLDEYLSLKERGKEVHFIPAEMNHRKARERAKRKRWEVPTIFKGALETYFESE